jgi:outer membrane protein OmpA-like peptidoglycan-associated protein
MKTKWTTAVLGTVLLFSFMFTAQGKPRRHYLRKTKTAHRAYSMAELKKNLEFDFAHASVRMYYDERLDQLANTIKRDNDAIALRGFADSIGTYKGNWVLSQKRADAVKAYLVDKGVAENKIVTTAFGSTKPVATNKTRAGRQKNRRVEILLDPVQE